MPDKEWADRVKGILKSELKRRGVSYRELSERWKRWESTRQSGISIIRSAEGAFRRCFWSSVYLLSAALACASKMTK